MVTLASVPIITKKKRTDKTRAQQHGVFACYWDKDGNIIGRYLINDAIAEAETIEDKKEGRMACKFNPPAGAKNFVVTLVGGGGGGCSTNQVGVSGAGGAGAPGAVIIEW